MASVIATATPYPGATIGFELEELSPFTGWATATDITEISAGLYSASVTDASHTLRARWEISAGNYTGWFTPSSVPGSGTPTAGQNARLAAAAIAKATRFLVLPEAPLGSWGEMSEYGMAVVRPDHSIRELLEGLHFTELGIDWASIVTNDDVIRNGLQADPADLPAERLPDITRALAAAEEWIELELAEGIGIA